MLNPGELSSKKVLQPLLWVIAIPCNVMQTKQDVKTQIQTVCKPHDLIIGFVHLTMVSNSYAHMYSVSGTNAGIAHMF